MTEENNPDYIQQATRLDLKASALRERQRVCEQLGKMEKEAAAFLAERERLGEYDTSAEAILTLARSNLALTEMLRLTLITQAMLDA